MVTPLGNQSSPLCTLSLYFSAGGFQDIRQNTSRRRLLPGHGVPSMALLFIAALLSTTAQAFIVPPTILEKPYVTKSDVFRSDGRGIHDILPMPKTLSSSLPRRLRPPCRHASMQNTRRFARFNHFSLAVEKVSKKVYIHFLRRIWSRSTLTRLRGVRGMGRAGIPHDVVTFRRRGPDRELTTIPQAERYSSGDWLHNIMNLPGSQVLQRISNVVMLNMLWAGLVSAVGSYFNLQAIPSRVHTLLGSSLGLLLVFRTNTSYGRYWEGRVLWEKLHGKSRDLARMMSLYEDCLGSEKVTAAARLICAYPLALREHLSGDSRKLELTRLLGPHVSEELDLSSNKPLWLCNRLGLLFRGVPESPSFSSRERLSLLGLVNDLSGLLGACERLVQTPVPLSYARHTSRFLTLYLWSLPMVLVADFSPVSLVFVTGLCTWALFGILEIGLLIEDPFQRVLKTSWTGVIADSVM